MSEEEHSENPGIDWKNVPENIFNLALKKCEKKTMEKMAYCAPDLNKWFPAKFVKSIHFQKHYRPEKVILHIAFIQTADFLDHVHIKGVFHNQENGTKTQLEWITTYVYKTSKTEYFIEKNYIELANTEFQKYLKLSQDNIRYLSINWHNLDYHTSIHPKMFKNLEQFTMLCHEVNVVQNIGYDSDDVLNWRMDRIHINANHWKTEDIRKLIINWLATTEPTKLDVGRRRFEVRRDNCNQSGCLNGLPYQKQKYSEYNQDFYFFAHPIFPDHFLVVDFQFLLAFATYAISIHYEKPA